MAQQWKYSEGRMGQLLKLNIANCHCIIKIKQENKQQFFIEQAFARS